MIKRNWYIFDVNGKILGRIASCITRYLIGKHKSDYAPYLDIGDYVIVINASKILVTGNKKISKKYYRHTGYIGGIKEITFRDLIDRYPERVIKHAVKGMLPKNKLGKRMYLRMKVYSGSNHRHQVNKPKAIITE
ncbi:50S ribosomal protein L13 [Candidatus Riesia pediculicola]|uniref:Large ribosomal subunit protein uL13 n=1 Tax=Riesia pediculicola (strain USDA) TaxID=515618 RepID=D4G7J9_RIEPU|nr:50S ribosomal protein L13 [Candidatus Riesia pediculicola]ADD79409.1 ribosomal protein L13 [Candidatus Riesia pediculicola USDA]ARC53578.1 50S ribosomal protein L13 [Candidatus Riesia pediculicola]ARC54051.1 50S ribosomal protein L13 [Candidatus Riesia pediculicola]ARC54509.1 50S ribosomal protein L13 [Candidatus Riesia pediculicola]QOJ86233.1 50S ribosomal protein L13 [Candidatus Riesia pediculicola]